MDWRSKDGVVQPVVNQGQSDNSKAIVTVRSIEALRAIQNKTYYDLSVFEVEHCCKNYADYFQCIVEIGGVADNQVYPSNSSKCQSEEYKAVAQINGAKFVPRGNEMTMAEAVAKQPVAAGVDASRPSFQLYKTGVYNDPLCSSSKKLDHWMLVVGYGTYEGRDYWLCQNSWGE